MTAMRTWTSATCRSKSRAIRRWPKKFNTVHLGLDAASSMVSAPDSPDRATEVFRSLQSLISGHGTRSDGLPRLCVFAGWDHGIRPAASDGVVAFAGIIGTVCGDATDRLVCRDLVEQIGQHRRITDVAPGDLDSANLQCFFVNPKVDLAPDAPFRATMLACVPLINRQVMLASPRGGLRPRP